LLTQNALNVLQTARIRQLTSTIQRQGISLAGALLLSLRENEAWKTKKQSLILNLIPQVSREGFYKTPLAVA